MKININRGICRNRWSEYIVIDSDITYSRTPFSDSIVDFQLVGKLETYGC